MKQGLVRPRAAFRALFVLAALAGIAPAALAQQGTGTVRGRIMDASTRQPVVGAQVQIVGTAQGAVTDDAGQYMIPGVSAGEQRVRVRRVGYAPLERPVTLRAGQALTENFDLSTAATNLDAVVVTGTAGATSMRTVGNAITKLDVEDITKKSNVLNVTEILQARSPGVQILPNSGTPGAAADIRIRGASSFIGNAPVFYIDGVRYSTESLGNFGASGAGTTSYSTQVTSALSTLSPDDIASIEVIKGPAAATLYGADAAGGVIQIITKRGAAGERPEWTAHVERGNDKLTLPIPDNYTLCDSLKQTRDASLWPGCAGVPRNTVLVDNPLRRDPYGLRTGTLQRSSLSVRGGSERFTYYVSGDFDREEGVFYNSLYARNSGRANFTFTPGSKLDFQVNSSYGQSHLRLPLGDESAEGLLLSAVRGKPGRVATNPGYAFTNGKQASAYNNQTNTERLTLSATANYRPFSWFRNRLIVGLDEANSLATILSPPLSVDAQYAGEVQGISAQRVPRNRIYSVDYNGNLLASVTSSLQSTTSFGMQVVAKRYESLFAVGAGLGAPDVTLVQTAQRISAANAFSANNSVGYYGQEQLGWNNRLFVTMALRADANSSFGANSGVIYYPKASLSWVLSEEPRLERFFDAIHTNAFKFRTAWGEAGRAPDPYSATQTYTVDKVTLGTVTGSALRVSSPGNPNLRPERGTEIEIGFDAGMFHDRMGVEFTYYRKSMHDLLQYIGLPGSMGFGSSFGAFVSSPLSNLGSTRNSGIELGLSGTLIQRENFAWDTRLNLSTNHNELVSFGDPRLTKQVPFQPYSPAVANQQMRPGYPLAGYWGAFPKHDSTGAIMYNATKTAVVLDTSVYIGPAVPTREIGFSNTFTLLKNFRVYSLFDYKGGHYLLNYKEYNRCRFNLNCALVNDPSVDPLTKVLWQTVPALYIEKANFVKLRDLSLTYTLPKSFASKVHVSGANLTLAGHNLALWTKYKGIDPEVNTTANRSFVRVDAYAAPMNRRVSLALDLSY